MPPKQDTPKPPKSGIPKNTANPSRHSERILNSSQSQALPPASPRPTRLGHENPINVDQLDKNLKTPTSQKSDEKSFSKKNCPCGKSSGNQCWILTCLDCKQAWHQACAGLKANFEKTTIESLLKTWQCPWCFTCPFTKPGSHVSNANAKNTMDKVLITSAAKNITDSISEENKKLSDMIQHLEDRLSSVNSDIDAVRDSQGQISERVMKLKDIEVHVQHQLLGQASLEQKMKSMQVTLATIQESISKVPQPRSQAAEPLAPTNDAPSEPAMVCHNQTAVADLKESFLDDEFADSIKTYLDSLSFKEENGHSVIAFGAPYKYTGSMSSDITQNIPDELQPLIEQINELQAEAFFNQYPDSKKYNRSCPKINSLLINKYEGSECFLPKHSDNEQTIHPESSIFTLSLGAQCNIDFTPIPPNTLEPSSISCSHKSLYRMSRKSQDFFSHEIKPGQVEDGTRYSLTFRSVSRWNSNSTCIIGDSNTGGLNFGTDKKKTFGEMMPGHRFWAPTIESIDPSSCCSYANAVIMCGINNIKKPNVRGPSDIDVIYQIYHTKVAEIRKLNPKCKIFICPILPTKSHSLNKGALYFNSLIFDYLMHEDLGLQCVNGFDEFLDNSGSGLLSSSLSKRVDKYNQTDMLHLNVSGIRRLAGFIKQSVFNRPDTWGRSRSTGSGRVNGRPYSQVAASSSPALRAGGSAT